MIFLHLDQQSAEILLNGKIKLNIETLLKYRNETHKLIYLIFSLY